MGRAPCCSKVGLDRGPWTAREDALLINFIQIHGEGHWRSLPKKAGLLRCGKSCRLRWMNYLRPDIKRGNITPDEDDLIVRLHDLLGNRWSLIAGRLPGRTDNEIKNYWKTHFSKRLKDQKTNRNSSEKGASKSKCVPSVAKKSDQDVGVTTKAKVHQPKPIRVSPFSSPIESFCHGERDHKRDSASHDSEVSNPSNLHVSWSNEIKDDIDFVQGYEAEANAAARATTPWKIYEDYQQFLKAEDHVQLESCVFYILF